MEVIDFRKKEKRSDKFEDFCLMIDHGVVFIFLYPNYPGVVVPEKFHERPNLGLKFCHSYGIVDFEYDEKGVRASLSFDGVDQWCDVPWDAVLILRDDYKEIAYINDLPRETDDTSNSS